MFSRLNDEYRLRRAKEGDQQAIQELFHRYLPRIYSYLLSIVNNAEEAWNLTQSAVAAIGEEQLEAVKTVEEFKHLLDQEATNLIRDVRLVELAKAEKVNRNAVNRFAADTLFERYRQPIQRFIYRLVHQHEDTEDLASSVFLKAWQKLETLESGTCFASWTYQIAKNQVRDWWKTKHHHHLSLDELVAAGQQAEEFEKQVEQAMLFEKVREEAMKKMKPVVRRCFELSCDQGLQPMEIKEVVGLKVTTVRTYLSEARETLREELHNVGWFGTWSFRKRTNGDSEKTQPANECQDRSALADEEGE